MNVIINGDDFALSYGQNKGIIDAYKNGVLTSTSLMANGIAFEDAVSLAQQNPELGLGVHCVLDNGYPCADPKLIPTLVDENHKLSKKNYAIENTMNPAEVKIEVKAQINKILEAGLTLDHLDSHHHIHCLPNLFETFIEICQEYNLPMRLMPSPLLNQYIQKLNDAKVKYVYCVSDFYMDNLEPEFFENLEKYSNQNDNIDIMCHPAEVDTYLLENSSYNRHREIELRVLKDPLTKQYLEDHTLTSYRKLKEI